MDDFTDPKQKCSEGGKTKFFDFFFFIGEQQKKLGKVKNFKVWFTFRSILSKVQKLQQGWGQLNSLQRTPPPQYIRGLIT